MSVAVMCRAALKLPKQDSIFSGRTGAEALVEPGERAFCLREPIGSRQETAFVREFSRQIFVDDVIEAPLGQRLLLGANAHFQQLVDGGDPCGMRLDEGVAPQRVPRAFDIGRGQRVRRVLEAKVDNILWRDAEETRPRRA